MGVEGGMGIGMDIGLLERAIRLRVCGSLGIRHPEALTTTMTTRQVQNLYIYILNK